MEDFMLVETGVIVYTAKNSKTINNKKKKFLEFGTYCRKLN